MLTKQQSDTQLAQARAHYRGTKDGIEWWWVAARNEWWGRRAVGNGWYELKSFPKEACNC